MAKKRVHDTLTIRVSLTPGICRWCRCTYDRPCANGCAWVDRTRTLCTACLTLDTAVQTAMGRRGLAELVHQLSQLALSRGTSQKTSQTSRECAE